MPINLFYKTRFSAEELLKKIILKPKLSWVTYSIAIIPQIYFLWFSINYLNKNEHVISIITLIFAIFATLYGGTYQGLLAFFLRFITLYYNFFPHNKPFFKVPDHLLYLILNLCLGFVTIIMFSTFKKLLLNEINIRHKAEEAITSRDLVMSIVAHDLRQPLTALVMQLQIGKLLLNKKEFGRLENIFENANNSLWYLDRMINNLQDVSKLESGRLILHKVEIEISQVLTRVINDFKDQAEKKFIQLELIKYEKENCKIKIDEDGIYRVFSNLIHNSIKFSPINGKISISVDCHDEKLAIIKISDTGPGVKDENIEFLFTKNWQDNAMAHLGSGLGLFICKGIVEAHEGKIWYETSIPIGASFVIQLPLNN